MAVHRMPTLHLLWAYPLLDGLGAGGGLAHNPGEFIELDYLPTRIALVAGLIRKIEANR